MKFFTIFALLLCPFLSTSQTLMGGIDNMEYRTTTVIRVDSHREMKKTELLSSSECEYVYVKIEGREFDDMSGGYTPVDISLALSHNSCVFKNGHNHYSMITNIHGMIGLKNGVYEVLFKEDVSDTIYSYSFKVVANKFVLDF